MAIEQDSNVLRYIRAIFGEGGAAELTDQQLLERFTNRPGRDDSADLAFAVLVERHGPMVLGVCRAALREEHDAQDAFQAVFLVLVHKARLLRVRDSLGPWLHAVALRIATHARGLAMKRRVHERQSAAMSTRSGRSPRRAGRRDPRGGRPVAGGLAHGADHFSDRVDVVLISLAPKKVTSESDAPASGLMAPAGMHARARWARRDGLHHLGP
jgi:hypothetical protein